MKILVIDVGGNNVKVSLGGAKAPIKIPSGAEMTAARMAAAVKKAILGSKYDAVSIGYPGPVVNGKPAQEPANLGAGWVRFDYKRVFGKPVRIVNDAAMQALGGYTGGRMLFLGLGTGLGSTMIVEGRLDDLAVVYSPLLSVPFRELLLARGITLVEVPDDEFDGRLPLLKERLHLCRVLGEARHAQLHRGDVGRAVEAGSLAHGLCDLVLADELGVIAHAGVTFDPLQHLHFGDAGCLRQLMLHHVNAAPAFEARDDKDRLCRRGLVLCVQCERQEKGKKRGEPHFARLVKVLLSSTRPSSRALSSDFSVPTSRSSVRSW